MFKKSLIALSVACVLTSTVHANSLQTHHTDYRTTPKIIFNPAIQLDEKNIQSSLLQYVYSNSALFAFNKNNSELLFDKTTSSLLAKHFHFKQKLGGVDIDHAEIIFSVSHNSGQVIKVFNNLHSTSSYKNQNVKVQLSSEQALNKAWTHLQSDGELLNQPESKLVYINEGYNFRLAYKTHVFSSSPHGDWQIIVDASSGDIIRVSRRDLPISKQVNNSKYAIFELNKGFIPFNQALAKYDFKKSQTKQNSDVLKTDATALVFDPDPRTTLNDESLTDTSAASSFDSAYVSRTLKDITLTDGTYSLVGPWVSIIDWDLPTNAPSTTTDGNWTAKRGNNAFNDAMTYFHLDQSQRYMQSLGFTGDKGIQSVSMGVDTDGAEGADNSYYSPTPNRLSFGHGCVDDNEDADVILHEYGHAINFGINTNWGGGDTGSMGEGFGDYWAGSYSYITTNGDVFNPNWVYSWDGHNECWNGRVLNRTNFQYDPTQSYGAHQSVNGQLGDELWATPLFQSLVALMGQGIPRSEVDQIILEAQFGLGSGLKMPDLALTTVQTAKTLFPDGPHSTVFTEKFRQVNILGDSIGQGQLTFTTTGNDAFIDPGETVNITLGLTNNGGSDLTDVSGTLSTTAEDTVFDTAVASYATIASGGSGSNTAPFVLSLDGNYQCDSDIVLSMLTSYTESGEDKTATFEYTLPVGSRESAQTSVSPGTSIPDNNTTGITSTLSVSGAGTVINDQFQVNLNITHSYRGDLKIDLTSPQGTTARLTNTQNDSTPDIVGSFPADFTPVDSFSVFDGQDLNGTWTLKIVDGGPQDLGTLNSWGLTIAGEPTCTGGNQRPIIVVNDIQADERSVVTLDASASSDPEAEELSFLWEQVSGESVSITNANASIATFTAPSVDSTADLVFSVTVSDVSGGSSSKNVNVSVANIDNTSPTASVSQSTITVQEGGSVSLNASSSSDAESSTLTYLWTQTSGQTATLNNANSAIASFTAPNVTADSILRFSVTVTDEQGANDSTSVTVNVTNKKKSGGGSVHFFSLIALGMVFLRRKLSKAK